MADALTGQALFESLLTSDARREWDALYPQERTWFMGQCADAAWANEHVPPMRPERDPIRVHTREALPHFVYITPVGKLTAFNAHGHFYHLDDSQVDALRRILDSAGHGAAGSIPWSPKEGPIKQLLVARHLTAAESMAIHGARTTREG
jgi:hypothetical protein